MERRAKGNGFKLKSPIRRSGNLEMAQAAAVESEMLRKEREDRAKENRRQEIEGDPTGLGGLVTGLLTGGQ